MCYEIATYQCGSGGVHMQHTSQSDDDSNNDDDDDRNYNYGENLIQ